MYSHYQSIIFTLLVCSILCLFMIQNNDEDFDTKIFDQIKDLGKEGEQFMGQ